MYSDKIKTPGWHIDLNIGIALVVTAVYVMEESFHIIIHSN